MEACGQRRTDLYQHFGDSLASAFRGQQADAISNAMAIFGISPRTVVFEITEHEHISNVPDLVAIARTLHQTGVRFALDDFGDGRSSLRLWAELEPDVVKIDKYFTRDIARSAVKGKTIRSLMQLAETFNTILVAEGIESPEDLRALRDLGIQLGQGYFMGRPEMLPIAKVNDATRTTLTETRVAILPTLTTVSKKSTCGIQW